MREVTTHQTDQTPPHQDKILHGVVYALAAFFLLTVMSACVKLLGDRHHAVELTFYRNVIAIIPFTLYLLVFKKYHYFKTRRPVMVAIRAIVGTTGMFVTFAAWEQLPLADATVIFFTATLLAPVLAVFLLKEQIGPHRWTAIIIGFTGVLFVAQPTGTPNWIGIALAFSAALFHSCIHVILRILKTESHVMVTYYFMLGGVLIPALAIPFMASPILMSEWPTLLVMGLSGGLAQILLAAAYRYAPVAILAPLHYTGLVWATGFDILIWHLVPGWPVFLGGAIIITANLYILYREKVQKTQTR